jgi:hypothetical protein
MYSSVCPGFEKPTASVLVTADGETKCGKTTIIGLIVNEAEDQKQYAQECIQPAEHVLKAPDYKTEVAIVQGLLRCLSFNEVVGISAGNAFRAATEYVRTWEEKDWTKSRFEARDADNIRELLAREGVRYKLQHDHEIEDRVDSVAQMPGAQTVCDAIFCDEIIAAYHANGGGNLVVVDARDPIGHLMRNNRLGNGKEAILPASIMPFYIDTPSKDSAQWMVVSKGGELEDWTTYIEARRREDAERHELPVTKPASLVDRYRIWEQQFSTLPLDGSIAVPLHFKNGEHMLPENIQWFAGHIALAAQNHRHRLQHLQPVA